MFSHILHQWSSMVTNEMIAKSRIYPHNVSEDCKLQNLQKKYRKNIRNIERIYNRMESVLSTMNRMKEWQYRCINIYVVDLFTGKTNLKCYKYGYTYYFLIIITVCTCIEFSIQCEQKDIYIKLPSVSKRKVPRCVPGISMKIMWVC